MYSQFSLQEEVSKGRYDAILHVGTNSLQFKIKSIVHKKK
jgi:hypothetical protein